MFRSLSSLLAGLSRPSAAAPRRTARPRVEALENRLVPCTIAGIVYNDVNSAGVFQTGDPLYANNPIVLLNAAGQQIASTTTDANGHYAFTVDQTIGTGPAVQEQDATFGPAPTDAPQTLQIQQFDPSLGTLTSVEIDELGTVSSHVQADNLDPMQATVQAQIQGSVTLQGAGLTNPLVANVQADESATLNASDGTMGFTGAAAHDFGSKDAQGTQSVTLDAATNDLSAFVGTGRTTLNAKGAAAVNLSGPGNLLAMIQSTVSGRVKVIYHYTPSNALRPGQYTVVQTANPPGTADGVNTSNGVPVAPGTPADTIPVTLPPGGSSLNNNFGEVTASVVSGFVYLDNNQNGVFDAGDTPIPNAPVTLSGSTALGGGVISLAATTDANGFYSFNVPAGAYAITQPALAGVVRDATNIGSLGGAASPGQISVNVPSGADGVNYDFGYVIPPPVTPVPPVVPPTVPPVTPPVTPPITPPVTPPLAPPVAPPVAPPISKLDFFGSTMWVWGF